ncbi:MAG: transglycosylase SLT domain-containing protein [Gemmatimonadota bacterium]|nr:MAG: transglycosylase SLT domain-containing protein [Gemmatimonadota bacterium]
MIHLKLIIQRFTAAVVETWDRLSATQRLTLRGAALLGAVLVVGALAGAQAPPVEASSDDGGAYTGTAVQSQFRHLRLSLDLTEGELELARLQLERAEDLLRYSALYQIPADLTELIYDVAVREGIDPELAFRLVKLESGFSTRALSVANAYGLAQVQPATARFYAPMITPEELYDPETNLSIGFRYLRDLLEAYGDAKIALLAYNRGPTRVKQLMEAGKDPANGYALILLEGYEGLR